MDEIVKIVFEDCGYAFARINENGEIGNMLFCFELPSQYRICNECELREEGC